MLEWLKSLFNVPRPAGPPRELASFASSSHTIAQGVVVQQDDGWRVECPGSQTVRLFELTEPGVDQCILTYRAEMKTQDIRGRAYLEMWCRFPVQGEFFSKGFHNAAKGTNDWASYEIPFFLKRGQTPDQIKLNLIIEGGGTVWIKNIQIMQTPLR